MNGATGRRRPAASATCPPAWTIVGTGDFNGDGKADMLWRDTSGNTAIWFMNGATVSSTAGLGNIPTAWSVVGTGDFNGDGKSDILWRDTSGNTAMWLMNGATVSSTGGPRQRAHRLVGRRRPATSTATARATCSGATPAAIRRCGS